MKKVKKEKVRNRFSGEDRYQPPVRKKLVLFEAFRTLPQAAGESYLHLQGDRELLIEGCREIISCGENHIRALVRGFILDIFGLELSVEGYTGSSVTVSGKIRSVSLEPSGKPRRTGRELDEK